MKKYILIISTVVIITSNLMAQEKSGEDEARYMQKTQSVHYDPPQAVSLIGTKLGDQVNFMTCAWFARLEANPYLFGISIQKQHFTYKAIKENNCFSLNIPTIDMIPRVDAVGMVSGKQYDKSQVFDVFFGENENSPLVDGCIVSYECQVVDTVSLTKVDETHPRAHTLIIAEVKAVWVNKKAVKDNVLNFEILEPILWTMSPNNYWTIGENKGRAFNQENRQLVPKKD
jgi:flavin reductase (DIM6/NTAB) family NADH-FMN oxidoreductase RutF